MTNLQRIRKQSGLTQKQLAEQSGVNLQMVQKYEQGTRNINKACVTTTIKLAMTLKCNIADILEKE